MCRHFLRQWCNRRYFGFCESLVQFPLSLAGFGMTNFKLSDSEKICCILLFKWWLLLYSVWVFMRCCSPSGDRGGRLFWNDTPGCLLFSLLRNHTGYLLPRLWESIPDGRNFFTTTTYHTTLNTHTAPCPWSMMVLFILGNTIVMRFDWCHCSWK